MISYAISKIVDDYYSEETCYESCNDGADALHALHPYEVVEAHGVESRPYTVTEVEPKCYQPCEVEYAVHLTPNWSGEQCLNEASTIGWLVYSTHHLYTKVVSTTHVHNLGATGLGRGAEVDRLSVPLFTVGAGGVFL